MSVERSAVMLRSVLPLFFVVCAIGLGGRAEAQQGEGQAAPPFAEAIAQQQGIDRAQEAGRALPPEAEAFAKAVRVGTQQTPQDTRPAIAEAPAPSAVFTPPSGDAAAPQAGGSSGGELRGAVSEAAPPAAPAAASAPVAIPPRPAVVEVVPAEKPTPRRAAAPVPRPLAQPAAMQERRDRAGRRPFETPDWAGVAETPAPRPAIRTSFEEVE